jgi:hypothetical protein
MGDAVQGVVEVLLAQSALVKFCEYRERPATGKQVDQPGPVITHRSSLMLGVGVRRGRPVELSTSTR